LYYEESCVLAEFCYALNHTLYDSPVLRSEFEEQFSVGTGDQTLSFVPSEIENSGGNVALPDPVCLDHILIKITSDCVFFFLCRT